MNVFTVSLLFYRISLLEVCTEEMKNCKRYTCVFVKTSWYARAVVETKAPGCKAKIPPCQNILRSQRSIRWKNDYIVASVCASETWLICDHSWCPLRWKSWARTDVHLVVTPVVRVVPEILTMPSALLRRGQGSDDCLL